MGITEYEYVDFTFKGDYGGLLPRAKETERNRLFCNEKGFAETKELPYGVYTVHQVSGWDGREP